MNFLQALLLLFAIADLLYYLRGLRNGVGYSWLSALRTALLFVLTIAAFVNGWSFSS